MARCPSALRPPVLFTGANKGLYGFEAVISSKVAAILWREPGLVGFNFLVAAISVLCSIYRDELP
jgi:hypothetical protein